MTSNRSPSLPARMLLLVFLVGTLCCAGDGAAPHTFTMVHLAHVANSSIIEFQGIATLNGVPSHSLQGGRASQLLPLEPPEQWQEMERSLQLYLESFRGLVQVVAKERQVEYPLDLWCTLGCQLGPDSTSHSFYEVTLNGDDFLSFRAANASWTLLGHRENSLALFIHTQLNNYPQTTSDLQAFLETTCMEFLRQHSKADGIEPAPHTFTMVHLAHVANSSIIEFQGIATLNGVPSHSLQGGRASQLLPLEPPEQWQEMERSLQLYLESFRGLVQVVAKERQVEYPLDLWCTLGCQLGPDSTSHSFYEVTLNGDDFLSFRAANASWTLLGHRENSLALFIHTQLNNYPQTTSDLQAFLETTCMEFLRQHSKADGIEPGQQRQSHTPLALGLTMGAFALAALAIGVFLCGGRWR